VRRTLKRPGAGTGIGGPHAPPVSRGALRWSDRPPPHRPPVRRVPDRPARRLPRPDAQPGPRRPMPVRMPRPGRARAGGSVMAAGTYLLYWAEQPIGNPATPHGMASHDIGWVRTRRRPGGLRRPGWPQRASAGSRRSGPASNVHIRTCSGFRRCTARTLGKIRGTPPTPETGAGWRMPTAPRGPRVRRPRSRREREPRCTVGVAQQLKQSQVHRPGPCRCDRGGTASPRRPRRLL
jgi:hypothetical protein